MSETQKLLVFIVLLINTLSFFAVVYFLFRITKIFKETKDELLDIYDTLPSLDNVESALLDINETLADQKETTP